MESFFINAGLAAGAALAAVPLILHLFMKQTPKRVIFPALRLIKERQKRSKKKLKVKNWLLLLARMALIALMALALARPRLYTSVSLGDGEVPTAIGLVFDTSLSMGYEERTKNRLTEAKERALEVVKKATDTSQVFVVDSAEPGEPPPLTPGAARKRIEALTLRAANRPLNAAIGQAYTAVAASDRVRKEVYVLTDLAASSWDVSVPVEGLDKVSKANGGVATYVLRLTPKDIKDVAVLKAEPSASIAIQGEPIEVLAQVRASGGKTTRLVELSVDGQKKDQKLVELPADSVTEQRFTIPKLEPGLHRGEIRAQGEPDALAFDDVRYFSFEVQPALRVLVVSDTENDASFVAKALDPDPTGPTGSGVTRPYRVDVIRSSQFAGTAQATLKGYACVYWLNVRRPTEADWQRLNQYVREGGGGLVVALGNLVQPATYNGTMAGQLLPGTIDDKPFLKTETTFGAPRDPTHPLFNKYTGELAAELAGIPVYKRWSVSPAPGSRTLLTYADGVPALLERVFNGPKAGRVLLWTTPLARRPLREDPASWNEFPQVGWSFVWLMIQTVPYLAGTSDERLNYEAGEDVILPLDPTKRVTNFTVTEPDGKTDRQTPTPGSTGLVLVAPQQIGQWSVAGPSADGGIVEAGFSINPPLSEATTTPLQTAQLDSMFGGKDKYKLADDAEKLRTVVEGVRHGQELFPWIMALILLLVTAENLLANTFYREGAGPKAAAATPGRAAA
ncbi:VWA domain-containing protein [Isosphaeraceae bacterium EP7]